MAAPTFSNSAAISEGSGADPITGTSVTGSVGDLLLLLLRVPGTATINSVSGSTSGAYAQFGSSSADASDDSMYGFWAIQDTTSGETITIDMSGSSKLGGIQYRITGASDSIAPDFTELTGTGANPDPPSHSPAAGAKDYMFVVFAGMDGETQTFSGPSGYTNGTNQNSGVGGAAASNCRVYAISKGTTAASSENPGALTVGAPSNGWTVWTIAVHPPGATGNTYTKAGFGRESA